MLPNNSVTFYICLIPVILVSLVFHEFSHAFVSYKLGDPTAKNMGRLNLNPLRHLDPLGTIMIVISSLNGFGFGWAKPVPINPRYYKNPKAGSMIVSLAGPVSNFLLAVLFSIPYYYIWNHVPNQMSDATFNFLNAVIELCGLGITINLSLAVFNLIPVPPLDGSKILSGILPTRYYFKMMEYENYIGMVFLLIILVMPRVLNAILGPVVQLLWNIIKAVIVPFVRLI
ncbi:MAG: site-2 protease family protein [Bacillota bacterium]|nr:site-2 protease family protein [Bacillota bacterium]